MARRRSCSNQIVERPALALIRWFVAGALLVPVPAGAQTTAADGVQAIVRGDYPAAVRILRPLAEDAPQPDPLAQYFMAMLYDSGHGVARSPMRACGLYLSAASPANPLMNQSLGRVRDIQEQFGGPAAAYCDAASAFRTPAEPPRTFRLAEDHSLTIDENGAAISYLGREKRVNFGGAGGVVALPILYTPLDVSRPVDARRHFIQSFLWLPSRATDPPTWTLGWMLSEVVGDDFSGVVGERELLAVTATRPPAALDLETLARIRVNANGEAEWTVAAGPNPRSGVVPFREPR
jgi:hypothetical protein